MRIKVDFVVSVQQTKSLLSAADYKRAFTDVLTDVFTYVSQ